MNEQQRGDETQTLTRRAALTAALAGAFVLSRPLRLLEALNPLVAEFASAKPKPFRRRLPIPRQLTGANITLPVKRARVRLLPGRKTKMWTYGGTFPGPTIRRPSGEQTKVTFKHRLGRGAGELTVHLHGGHNRSSEDGQPGGLTKSHKRSLYCDISSQLSEKASGNSVLIRAGRQRTYKFDLMEDGEPERAAFQWYHDHRLDHTARNVWRGLAGMWIIDDDVDAALPLPRGSRDLPLMIVDRSFNRRNQLTNPFSAGRHAPHDGITGKYVLVNGAYKPYKQVSARRYRLRILNASQFRSYNLYLTGGVKIVQIATESGLMPAPVNRKRVLVGPAERVELIVDFSGARGKRIRLKSGKRSSGGNHIGSHPYVGSLMEFRVAKEVVADDTSVPAGLRPLPGWADPAPSTHVDHRWKITVGGGIRPSWLINGKTFSPGRVEAKPHRGSVVTWEVQNRTAVAHMFHIHQTDWLMLRRNGHKPAAHERCLKETFFMDPGDRILLAGKLSDYLGKFVVHCHMLDHEDHGLMSQFKVVP